MDPELLSPVDAHVCSCRRGGAIVVVRP